MLKERVLNPFLCNEYIVGFKNSFGNSWQNLFTNFAVFLSLIYLLILTFPGHYYPINPNILDDSWIYALNCFANSNYLFGQNIIFTYGPLAYLMVPRHIGFNIEYGICFMLIFHICFALLLIMYLKAEKNKTQFLLFVLCYAITFALSLPDNYIHLWYEYWLLLTFLLVCYLPGKLNKPIMLVGLFAGMVVPVFAMIKFSLACTCFLALFLTAVSWKLEFGNKANASIIAACISLLISLTTVIILFFKSFTNFYLWLLGSWEIAKGYGESMGLLVNNASFYRGIFLLTLTVVAILVLLWKRTQVGYLALISLGAILVSFKHSYIRQQTPFFLLYLGIICTIGLACRNEKIAYRCFWLFAFVCLLALYPLSSAGITLPDIAKILDTTQGQRNIRKLLHLAKTEKDLDTQTKNNFSKCRLPKEFLSYIKAYRHPTVLAMPDCFGYSPANDLNWDVLPVIQLYCAYTPYLDKLCADHFDSTKGPEFIIWSTTTDLRYGSDEIDGKNSVLESPLTTLAILRNYNLAKSVDSPGILLLERRQQPRTISIKVMKSGNYKTNSWIDVPKSSALITGVIKLKPNLLPYTLSKLIKLPEIDLSMGNSSTSSVYRMIQPNFSSGILLNCCPRNVIEFGKLFKNENPNLIQSIKMTGPGCNSFNSQFEIVWSELIIGR
jgi:hypothetical protein